MPKKIDSIKCVVFDLDDTLYPQIDYDRACLFNTAQYISGLCGAEMSDIKKTINQILNEKGIEYRKIYNDLFDKIGFDGMPYIKKILEIYWQTRPQIYAYPKVYDMLTCISQYCRLAVITDGYPHIQHYKIECLRLADYFEKIYVTDAFGIENRKPSIYAFERLLTEMNIYPHQCVYVGNDPRKDFYPAKKVGMYSVQIRQVAYSDILLSSEHKADFTIDKIGSLSELFNFERD